MTCRNNLCAYYAANLCTVEAIEINELGMCDTCIMVDIPENYLSVIRNELLRQLENGKEDDEKYGN